MEPIKIVIKKDTKASESFQKFMDDKKEFRNAVTTGKGKEFIKKHHTKIATTL